jgi:hypothetical protein
VLKSLLEAKTQTSKKTKKRFEFKNAKGKIVASLEKKGDKYVAEMTPDILVGEPLKVLQQMVGQIKEIQESLPAKAKGK